MHQILPELFPFLWKVSAYCILETNLCRTLKLNIYFLYIFFFDWSINSKIISLYNLYLGVYDKMLRTQYLRSYLTYEIDIEFVVPWPYVKVLMNFWADSIIYYQSYALFVAIWLRMRPHISWTWICLGPWNFICPFCMTNKLTNIFSSPEPKAQCELLWSLTVRRRRRPSVCPSVRSQSLKNISS